MKRLMFVILIGMLLLGACTICPPCPECPTPEPTATVEPTATPPPDKPACWDGRLDEIGVTVERRDGQYELVAAWVIKNGNWDDPEIPACVMERWPYVSGAEQHAFGRVETANGASIVETFGLVWGTGEGEGDTAITELPSGWANLPIYGGLLYDWFPFSGDKLCKLLLPGYQHWTTYGVWWPKMTLHEMDEAQMEVLR